MKTLSIDIETYSSEDLTKTGVYKYAEAEDFEILLFAYAYDDRPVEIIDLASGETFPPDVYSDLINPTVLKTAFNANFEITCLREALKKIASPMLKGPAPERGWDWKISTLPADQWECTMVKSAMLGLPMSLDGVAKALNLEQQKMAAGRALIRYFSMPCKPTKSNGMRTRNLPHHDPDKWALFKEYCKQDVETERAIRNKEKWFTIPQKERELWLLDQRIIGTGVLIDRRMVENAIRMDDDHKEILTAEATELTGLDNPNSPAQLKEWLTEQTGEEVTSLNKTDIPGMLDASDSEEVTRVLELRQEMSKTSTKKYQAMLDAVCADGRVRGLLQFYGASRTGRWCLTGDHEVLTDRGWVRLDEWQGGQIACWNSMGEAISFQKATPNEFNYEGEMVSVDCQRCAQLSTPEHTMPYWDNGWKSDEIQNLTKRFKMPFTGKKQNTQDFENYDLRVLIMTQADGHYTEWQDLKFHFTKTRKIERCKMLLRRAGIPFMLREHKNATVISVYHRHQPLYLRMFKNKVFGDWLLEENADVFFDELEHWDSYRCGPNSIQYSSTVKQNVDIVQAMAALSGRSCTVVVKSRKESPSWSDAYVANIWLTPGLHTEIRREFISRVSYSGKVYCPSTQTGFFMVRRNGKVWVTGNSGRNVQIQNLPQNHLPDLDLARETVIEGDRELVEMLYGNVPDTLSQLIRTAFVAPEGHRFIVADFSAIEARVTAWLAGEKWRLDVFASHGKIYEASASQMFKVPIDSIDKGSPLRQKGKIAELACIAAGQLVTTDMGLIPIEKVTAAMKVWDGEKFVQHKGVIYKGLKKVIEYEGFKATEDHLVWVEGKHRPIPFGDAARSGSRLLKPSNGGKSIRKRKDHKPGAEIHQGMVGTLCANRMLRVWQKGMDNLRKFNKGLVKRVPNVFSSETNTQMAGSPFNRCQTEMRKPERRKLQKLRGSWHRVSIWLNFRGGAMDDRGQRLTGATHGAGQNRRKWTLRKGEFKVGYTPRELPEPTPVYDILECGEKNRFVVSGVLVHNCGYGGGVGALKAMGADKMGLSDEELQETITQWRLANPNIVRLWYDIQEAAMTVIGNIGRVVEVRGCRFKWDKGLMWITLPSGRSLCYATPGIGRNRFGGDSITYWGINQTTRKWEKQETYGGKLVENLSQAIARDCLAHSMLRLDEEGFKIVMHVHDEVVIEEPYDGKTMDEACRIMGEPISWAPGLLLRADGYETEYYKKD